jgi:hypothetical protein
MNEAMQNHLHEAIEQFFDKIGKNIMIHQSNSKTYENQFYKTPGDLEKEKGVI